MPAKWVDKLFYLLSVPLAWAIIHSLYRLDVKKKSPLPHGPKIIAVNHPSFLDPLVIASVLSQQSYIFMTEVMFRIPVIRTYLRLSGHIPVTPGHGEEALQCVLEHLRQGHTIMNFPEGNNSPMEGGFLKEHTGIARMALASGVPVYPAGIFILRERLRTRVDVVDGKTRVSHWYMKGPFVVTIGSPTVYQGDHQDRDRCREVAHAIMLTIMNEAAESQKRWEQKNTNKAPWESNSLQK